MALTNAVTLWILAASFQRGVGRGISISPTSISAGKATQISFTGASCGDKVYFTSGPCASVTDDDAAVVGKGGKAVISIEKETEDLRLCLKPVAGGTIAEQVGVKLDVIAATPESVIESASRSSITKGVTTAITLKGASSAGKAIFIPTDKACSDATPKVVLDDSGRGLFTIPSSGKIGDYKLCYQSPSGSDSIEQKSKEGVIQIKVLETTTTSQDTITGISPSVITVNVPTVISLTGSGPGDRAVFVHSDSSDCAAATPDKDMGAGHAMFTITKTGEYTLCYRVTGTKDSVAQSGDGVKLQVKAPGVTKEMVGRWQSKDGKLDCSSMDYVPFCGVSLEEKCGQTYTVQSGIGYKCNWNEAVWPPKCAVQSFTDPAKICISGKCANDACW